MIDPLLTRRDVRPATRDDVAYWGALVCSIASDQLWASLVFLALALWIQYGSRR